MISRFVSVSLLAGLLVASAMTPAAADDLSQLLEAAAEADYAGRNIVVTFMDGEATLEIIDVEHAGSLMMVESPGSESVLESGKLSGGDGGGLVVSTWNASRMSDRYTVESPQAVRRLSREATAIGILEDGRMRMRLVFDDVTGTPLVTEVYDGDGTLFRFSSMIEMDPIPSKLYSAHGHYSNEFEVLVPTARHSLPVTAAGYRLADAYVGPDDSIQGFYSDGLFSFSLFVVAGSAESDRFADAATLDLRGLAYKRVVNPGEMWVTWESSGNTLVLVGDLPPDHLEEVLAELPQPPRRSLLSRLWSGIFG